jgi:helicase
MQMHELAEPAYDIPREIIDIWIEEEGTTLLPIQRRAIEEQNLLAGRNLVIAAPSSAGKTFVGEIAIIARALEGKRALYVVPLKAMADEKYRLFRRRYGSERLGLEIVASTADLNEFDVAISQGLFDIAIIVNEKLDSIFVQNLAIVEQIGLIVIDEIQMMGDETRGPTLEMLISKILALQTDVQIFGLSASLTGLDNLAEWLRASLVIDPNRPVELREGVLHGSKFRYRCHNSNAEYTETWPIGIQSQSESVDDVIIHLLRDSEVIERPVIIFCPTRRKTTELAKRIAQDVPGTRASEAIERLRSEITETELTQKLMTTLEQGIAFHSAELYYEVRELLEDQFRADHISVLCATSTLAMGINTPAKTVIFQEPIVWRRSEATKRWNTELLPPSSYKNMAGRAGRTKAHDDYGTSMLIAPRPIQKMKYWQGLVNAQIPQIRPQLFEPDTPLEIHILKLIAANICETSEQVEDLLHSTFSGFMASQQSKLGLGLSERIQEAIEASIKLNLIRTDERKFDPC